MTQQPDALRLAEWMENFNYPKMEESAAELRRLHAENERLKAAPTAQRQWVGMTEEEMQQACYEAFSYDPYVIARAIEAKLKEKNGGSSAA